MATYLLDANVLIEAKNLYYGFDIVPAFWQWLEGQNRQGSVATVSMILAELEHGNDELATWAKERRTPSWSRDVSDEATQTAFRRIANWVKQQAFQPPAKALFLGGADPWLIAHALTIGATVVTLERFSADVKHRVPIPNVCRQFKVPYLSTFALLRDLRASFR